MAEDAVLTLAINEPIDSQRGPRRDATGRHCILYRRASVLGRVSLELRYIFAPFCQGPRRPQIDKNGLMNGNAEALDELLDLSAQKHERRTDEELVLPATQIVFSFNQLTCKEQSDLSKKPAQGAKRPICIWASSSRETKTLAGIGSRVFLFLEGCARVRLPVGGRA